MKKGELIMPNQQELENFWAKLTKACAELQHDFAKLDLQDKQEVKKRINTILEMQGTLTGVDTLIGVMENLRC